MQLAPGKETSTQTFATRHIDRSFTDIGVEVDSPDAPSIPATPEAVERVLAVALNYGIEFKI